MATSKSTGPRFALFVRSVDGRLVSRFGTTRYLGAQRTGVTEEDRRAGAPVVEWDIERVTPISEQEFRTYRKEFLKAIRNGDLKKATHADYLKWLQVQKAREEKHEAELEAREAEAEKAAKAATKQTQPASSGEGADHRNDSEGNGAPGATEETR